MPIPPLSLTQAESEVSLLLEARLTSLSNGLGRTSSIHFQST